MEEKCLLHLPAFELQTVHPVA